MSTEAYRIILASGCRDVAGFVVRFFGGKMDSDKAIALFTAARLVDARMALCRSEQERIEVLLKDDAIEINLSRICAWIYERRTGDRNGALHMLRIRPPGAGEDIAPTWCVTEATAHSKQEFQVQDRVARLRKVDTKGGGKGDGAKGEAKGKGKGDGKGKKGKGND